MEFSEYYNLSKEYLSLLTRLDIVLFLTALEGFFTFPFLICSFVVAGTANAGFNCVLTGLLNASLAIGSYLVITKSKAPIAIGFLIGSTTMIALLNLMTAIYWGQLSGCKGINGTLAGYSCSNTSAYSAVSAFASLLFIVDLAFTASLVVWRDDFIEDSSTSSASRGSYSDLSIPSANLIQNVKPPPV